MALFGGRCAVLMCLFALGMAQRGGYSVSVGHQDDLVVGGITEDVTDDLEGSDLTQTFADLGLTTLNDLLGDAGLTETFDDDGPYTVFAPTNQAFTQLGSWRRRRMRNVTILARTLKHHVTSGRYMTSDLQDEMLLDSSLGGGKKIRINVYPRRGSQTVYTAQCAAIDQTVETSNGDVVHTVDKVLVPPFGDMLTSLTECPVFVHLTRAMRLVGLDDDIDGPYTMFPPTDRAIERVFPGGDLDMHLNRTALIDFVQSHVVLGTVCTAGMQRVTMPTMNGRTLTSEFRGGDIYINGIRLISRDGVVANGVAHTPQSPLWP